MVLGGYLHDNLQILSDVGLQHRLETLEAVLHGERAKVADEPFRVQHVRVNHGSLYVVQICEMLQCLKSFQNSVEHQLINRQVGLVEL